jgi:hypothetical protein
VAIAGERRINGTFHLTPRPQVMEFWWRLLPDAELEPVRRKMLW